MANLQRIHRQKWGFNENDIQDLRIWSAWSTTNVLSDDAQNTRMKVDREIDDQLNYALQSLSLSYKDIIKTGENIKDAGVSVFVTVF